MKRRKKACIIAKGAGVNFVKISIGFGAEGVTVHDVKLMLEAVGEEVEVKAAGGVRNHAKALEMINAGTNRIILA